MFRVCEIFQLAGIVHQVVQRYVAARVEFFERSRIAVFFGAEPAHQLVLTVDDGAEEVAFAEIGRAVFLSRVRASAFRGFRLPPTAFAAHIRQALERAGNGPLLSPAYSARPSR